MKTVISALLCGLLLFSGTSAMAGAPTDAVRGTVDAVLTLLKDGSLDKMSRREKMRALINERFDFRAMSQRTLATNWRKASDDQKDRFVNLFAKLIQDSYVTKIEAYTNEKVQYGEEKVKGNKAIVDTLILTENVDIPINYKLVQREAEWRVYDVVIEEVSLISSYRSTYREIVKKDGFDGLFAKMEAKIEELGQS